MKNPVLAPQKKFGWGKALFLLAIILIACFWRSFLPGYVHFSNDTPLGMQATAWTQLPGAFTGAWVDLNDLGANAGAWPVEISQCIRWVIGPVNYAKFLPPIALFILGFGAWAFFRQLRLSPMAATLGALAMVLNSTLFSGACWGVASQEIAFGMTFFALALIVANNATTPKSIRWVRLSLAGLCIGMNVMEAADIGALCSIVAGIFVFYKSLIEGEDGILVKSFRGVARVAVVAIFAGFLATQTIVSLVSTQIEGVSGTAQDTETKAQHWDWATQWSLPKTETLGIFIPGLFGYRMDTPKDMMPQFTNAYEGGVYWGGMGRSPEIDRFLDNGGQGQMPQGMMRFSGGGDYCGILVALLAFWTIAQSLRKKNSPFSNDQKKLIWFWSVVLIVSLLLAWGRFAPIFYGTLYQLPYFSTIRNPAKFIIFFSWAIVILFAYGVHAISLRYLVRKNGKSADLTTQLKTWWARADGFDRKWTWTCVAVFGASVVGWLIFSSEKSEFVAYLQRMGFPDESLAKQIAAFSLGQLGWFVALLAVAIVILTLTIAGYFSGPRARLGAVLLGTFLVFDLGRADLPYIIHWNYKQKYEVGSLNPIVKLLTQKPYEHRVAGLPFHAPQGLELFDQLYRIEWMQHLFPYYNVQSLDIVQMPRMPENLKAYLAALTPNGTAESVPLLARYWELTNTRYLLGAAGYLGVLNEQLDPVQKRFRIVQRFDVVPKPGVAEPQSLEELTAVPDQNGNYALFDFTGALPRAKLYSNWRVNTNDPAVLKTLADLKFDPHQTVLVDTPVENLPELATNENSGSVEFKSYTPKTIVFDAKAASPSVLLLNDKYDPHWHVTVDGKPAALMRCDYLMRGVYLEPGQHTVTFHFQMPNGPLYVTLTAIATGVLLLGLLVFLKRKTQNPAS
jgi:hypothetical protein